MKSSISFDAETFYDFGTDWIDEIDDIMDTVDNVKRELNRKLALANKYGYDEYADELARLLEKMDAFRKARK